MPCFLVVVFFQSSSVVDLNKRFGSGLTWFVPSGMKSWMVASGCENVKELSWWQEEDLEVRGRKINFACVPAVHWSNRGITDRNKVSVVHCINNTFLVLVLNLFGVNILASTLAAIFSEVPSTWRRPSSRPSKYGYRWPE